MTMVIELPAGDDFEEADFGVLEGQLDTLEVRQADSLLSVERKVIGGEALGLTARLEAGVTAGLGIRVYTAQKEEVDGD